MANYQSIFAGKEVDRAISKLKNWMAAGFDATLDNMTATDTYDLITINSATYAVLWRIAPTSSNAVYGIGLDTASGRPYQIYNDHGTYSAVAFDANTDTKNTAGASSWAATSNHKLYLIGADNNTSTYTPTFTDTKIYVDSNHKLFSNNSEVLNTGDTQTITGSKTFNTEPTIVFSLLAKYQPVEYIKFRGTDYILIENIPLTQDTNYTLNLSFSELGNGAFGLFGKYDSTVDGNATIPAQYLVKNTVATNIQWYYGSDNATASPGFAVDTQYEIKVLNKKLYIDNVACLDNSSTAATFSVSPIMAGNRYTANGSVTNGLKGNLYSFSMTDTSNAVHTFMPCYKKSDNKVGFIDTTTSVFYPLQSYGSVLPITYSNGVTAGPTVNNVALTATSTISDYVAANGGGSTLAEVTANDNITAGPIHIGGTLTGASNDNTYINFGTAANPKAKNAFITTYNNGFIMGANGQTLYFMMEDAFRPTSNANGAQLKLGNSTRAWNSLYLSKNGLSTSDAGAIVFNDTYLGTLKHADLTAAQTWTLPNKTGTIALTSDLTADTKDTTGATNWGATNNHKLYLVGTDNSTSNYATTYTDGGYVYVDSNHRLFSNNSEVVNLADNQVLTGQKKFTQRPELQISDVVSSEFVVAADLADVATSGSYNDLSNKPTIPTVSDATITVTQTGQNAQTFTLNGSAKTIALADTKDTAGSSQVASNTKIYLVGAQSLSSTGVTTHADSNVYLLDSTLYSNNNEVLTTAISPVTIDDDQLITGEKTFEQRPKLNTTLEALSGNYTELEYVHFDGSTWFNTGLPVHMNYRYELAYKKDNLTGYRMWGAFNQSSYNGGFNASLTYATYDAVRWTTSGDASQMIAFNFSYDTNKHTVVINNGQIFVDGTNMGKSAGHSDSGVSNYNAFLGTINPGGTTTSASLIGNIYYYKVYDDTGALVQDWVPCKSSSNVVGFYDKVSDQFKTAASGTPTAGPNATVSTISEFEYLDYVEFTGTQYIDTLIQANGTLKAEATFTMTSIPGTYWTMAGARNGSNNRCYLFGTGNNSAYWGFGYIGTLKDSTIPVNADVKYHCSTTLAPGMQVLFVNDQLITTNTEAGELATNTTIYIGGLHYSGSTNVLVSCKVYQFKIWQNGTLVRDFIPTYSKPLQKAGLYDRVSQTFFEPNAAIVSGNTIDQYESEFVTFHDLESSTTNYLTSDEVAPVALSGNFEDLINKPEDTKNTAGASNWGATSGRKLYLVGTDNTISTYAATYTDANNIYVDSSHKLFVPGFTFGKTSGNGIKTIIGQTRIQGDAAAGSADNTSNGFSFWKSTTTTFDKTSEDYLGLISPNDSGALGFYGRNGLYFRPKITNGVVDTTVGVTMNSTGLFPGGTSMPLGNTSSPWGNIYGNNIHTKNIYLNGSTLTRVSSFGSTTALYTYTLPDATGTVALTSDIPTVENGGIPSVSNDTITIKQEGISDQTFTLNGTTTTINLKDTKSTAGATNWGASANHNLYLVGTDNSTAASATTYTDAANLYVDSSHALHAKEYVENGTPIAQLYRTPEIKRYI